MYVGVDEGEVGVVVLRVAKAKQVAGRFPQGKKKQDFDEHHSLLTPFHTHTHLHSTKHHGHVAAVWLLVVIAPFALLLRADLASRAQLRSSGRSRKQGPHLILIGQTHTLQQPLPTTQH